MVVLKFQGDVYVRVTDSELLNIEQEWEDMEGSLPYFSDLVFLSEEDAAAFLAAVNAPCVYETTYESYNYAEDCEVYGREVTRKPLAVMVHKLNCEFYPMDEFIAAFRTSPIDTLRFIQKEIAGSSLNTRLYTESEWNEMESEEERERLESTAAWFQKICGHPVGSRAYVQAAITAINRAEEDRASEFSDESRRERFMDCHFSGGDYYADEDYLAGKHADKLSRLGAVLDWLKANFPLLTLQEANRLG